MFELTPAPELGRIHEALAGLERDGVIQRIGNRVRINDEARSLCRVVAAAIDPYTHAARTAPQKIASAV